MHDVFRIAAVALTGPHRLRLSFDDGLEREIDFEPVLAGEMYGPLRDEALFRQVTLDPEVQTIVWPNGADFDPETLHNWPQYEKALIARAKRWQSARA